MKTKPIIGLCIIALLVISGCAPKQTEEITTDPIKEEGFCGDNTCNVGEKYSTCSQDCKLPEMKDLVIQEGDMPEGWGITVRGDRAKTDIQREARDLGWERGYHVKLVKTEIPTIYIEDSLSIYPKDKISQVIALSKQEIEKDRTRLYDNGESEITDLPNPNIGDDSMAYRETITYYNGGSEILYQLEFIKEDVYHRIVGIDYELVKELSKKVADRI